MSLAQNLTYSLRSLRKSPGFTAATLVCLTLGIGATSAMFTVAHSVLLAPLPYPQPDRIVGLWNHLTKMELYWLGASAPEYLEYVEQNQAFERIAAYYTGLNVTVRNAEGPESVPAAIASPDLFPLLGVKAVAGRTFLAGEGVHGNDNVVLLSHGFWRRWLGGNPAVVGTVLEVSGQPLTIVGVLPEDFRFAGDDIEIWAPLALDPQDLPARRNRYLEIVGRLRDGISLEQAQARIASHARRIEAENLEVYRPQGRQVVLLPLKERMVAEVRPALAVLLGAVGLVLGIACVNVANLLLVRATRREGELAVRIALGATRPRVLGQVLTESAVLGLLGGVLGLLAAYWTVGLILAIHPEAVPRAHEIRLDGTVVAFTAALSLATGLAFGLMPALQLLNRNLQPLLKEGGRSLGALRGRSRSALVICEIALAFVLLVGAGLLVESLRRARQVDPGFDPGGLLTARIALPFTTYRDETRVAAFFDGLLDRVEALPGVRGAAIVSVLPLSGADASASFVIQGWRNDRSEGLPSADEWVVSPGFHRTLGIPLREGRGFAASDGPQSQPVALIDETLARRHWPTGSPLGQRIQLGSSGAGPWLTIVGVVGHVKQAGLDKEARGQIYTPLAQVAARSVTLMVRASGDPLALAPGVRKAILEIDRAQPVFQIRTMEQVLAESFAPRRFSTALLGTFSAIALILAAVGIYGVMAYDVAQRSREIGLRVAMGAQSADVLRLVVGQGMILALAGLAAGGLGAVGLTRFLASQLFGVESHDPLVFAAVAAVLAAIGLLASYVPARRALRLDPVAVLKAE